MFTYYAELMQNEKLFGEKRFLRSFVVWVTALNFCYNIALPFYCDYFFCKPPYFYGTQTAIVVLMALYGLYRAKDSHMPTQISNTGRFSFWLWCIIVSIGSIGALRESHYLSECGNSLKSTAFFVFAVVLPILVVDVSYLTAVFLKQKLGK